MKPSLFFIFLLLTGPILAKAQGPKLRSTQKTREPARTKALPDKCLANGLTQAEVTELLASQNRARSELKLPPLVWDCKMANMAQQWAAKGVFEHRVNNFFGENLFVSADAAEPVSTAIKTWIAERSNWTNKTASCARGKTCTHYTQVVWNTTAQVGCGVNRNVHGQWKTLLVCNYNPAGNSGGPAY